MPEEEEEQPKKLSPQEIEELFNEISNTIYGGWKREDMPLIEGLYPDALAIVPMYRSALVVLPPTEEEAERGSVTLVIHHDPAWMGHETTPETLQRHSAKLHLFGQRSFVEAMYDSAECGDGGVWFHDVPHDEVCPICRGTGEGNWHVPAMIPENNDRAPEDKIMADYCNYCWGQGKISWRPDADNEERLKEGLKEAAMTPEELTDYNEKKWKDLSERFGGLDDS